MRNVRRVLKVAFLTLPLVAAAWCFGVACGRLEAGHLLLVLAVRDLLLVLRDFILAWAVLTLTSDIVALLFRPLWIAAVAFLVSGLALFLGSGATGLHGLVTVWFLVAALSHAAITQRNMSNRIDFSIDSVTPSQSGFLVVLLLLAVWVLYMGAAGHLQREEFLIPEQYSEEFAERLASRVAAPFPTAIRQQVHDAVQSHAQQLVTEELDRLMKPVRPYIAIAAALALFLPLLAVSSVLPWAILPALWLLLALLRLVGFTRLVTETIDVQRLVLT